MRKTILCLSIITWAALCFSQEKNIRLYQRQVPMYKNWLKSNQLDGFLSVETFDKVGDSGPYQLYLKFNCRFDSVTAYWKAIDQKLHKERDYGIDSLLYFAGLNTFQIAPTDFNIIIYENYDATPLDTVGIYYDKDKKSVESYISFDLSKGQSSEKILRLGKKGDKASGIELESFDEDRVALYAKVLKILKIYYKKKVDGGFTENFVIRKDEENEEIHLFITNLRGQIIPNEKNPWLVRMANYFMDASLDVRRLEGVEIKINLKYLDKQRTKLNVWVDARYGSGVWGVSNWNHAQNYEPEYEMEVRNYSNRLADVIKTYLKK